MFTIYLIGFAVAWTVATVRDNLVRQETPAWAQVIGRCLICVLWPVLLPHTLGITIAVVVKTLGRK